MLYFVPHPYLSQLKLNIYKSQVATKTNVCFQGAFNKSNFNEKATNKYGLMLNLIECRTVDLRQLQLIKF